MCEAIDNFQAHSFFNGLYKTVFVVQWRNRHMKDGEFKKVTPSSERLYGPKGIVFCGFAAAEHEPLVNALSQIGFGDRPLIFATDGDVGKSLKELLTTTDRSGMGESTDMPRATIMSGCTQMEVHTLMTAFKEAGFPRQLWATLTPISEDWHLGALLEELIKEDVAFRDRPTK